MNEARRSPALAEWRRRCRRRRCARVVALLSLSVGVGLALGAGESLLALRELRIVSTDRTLAAEVARNLTLPPHPNLLTTPIVQFTREAEKCPRVARAEIERRLPDRLILAVHPRRPLIALEENGRYLLIDEDGVCLYWCQRPRRELLRVAGWHPRGAQVGERLTDEWFERSRDIAQALSRSTKLQPWRMEASNPPELTVVSGSGARGIVGVDGDTVKRAKLFAEVLQELEARGNQVGRVELRTRRPIWWPKSQCVASGPDHPA